MPYIRTQVEVDFTPLKQIEQRGRAMPALLQTAVRREIGGLRSDFLAEIAPPLGAHKRPTDFETPKQRGWWFKVGIHLWHGRTGALEKGWRADLKTTNEGGIFSVFNVAPSKVFVQGFRQQRMHIGTWQNEKTVIVKYQVIAQVKLTEIYKTVSNPYAGVPQ